MSPISGGVGGCPPPVAPPVSPPVAPPPPPGIPAFVASPAGAKPGSRWIDSATHRAIMANGDEYQGTGISIATPPGAVVGSTNIDGEDNHYIDASGVERRLHAQTLGAKDSTAIPGSEWVDPAPTPTQQQYQWIGGTTRWKWWNGF